MKKTALLLSAIIISIFMLAACDPPKTSNNSANAANSDIGKVPTSGGECTQNATEPSVPVNSPTEAFSFLFESVKKGDTSAIKSVSSQATRELAQIMSSQYKKSCAESYKNGFTETTMQEKMPETRDLREDGNVAALEIKRADGRWEDVTFVKEGSGWKIASGDLFFGKIKSPGKPQSMREQENANARGINSTTNPMGNSNSANGNKFEAVPVPDGPVNKPLQRPRPGQTPPPAQ
jgi:hypothetical protein